MSGPFHDWLKLRDETNQARLDFIWIDLDVCLTFAAIVESEYTMGNREHAERTLASAEKGYSDTLPYLFSDKGADEGNREELPVEVQARS